MSTFIDTHCHLDGEEFQEDLAEVIERAKEAGAEKMFVPAINLEGLPRIIEICKTYKGICYPMIGLHPEDVNSDYVQTLDSIKAMWNENFIAIGEIGLDFYWSREFEKEQLDCFERQVQWAIEVNRPLMIHCRKAQNEMVKILRRYEKNLTRGGVFHCFTGNEKEAEELLSFENFVLGIGGVSTFKSSHLPEVLPAVVPLNRIVPETDSPYMAPVPHRGKRNEPSFIPEIIRKLAEAYQLEYDEICRQTNETVKTMFLIDN